jgi:hypothetical protein
VQFAVGQVVGCVLHESAYQTAGGINDKIRQGFGFSSIRNGSWTANLDVKDR